MSISISQIQTAGDYFRRSTETSELTAAKKLEAAALAIEDVHSQGLFKFTQRRQAFNYFEGETDYSLLESLNVPDFREVKDVRNIDVNTWAFDYIDPNQFDTSEARYPDRPMYTVEYRNGDPVLRISQTGAGSSKVIHAATSYNGDGTWTADTTSSDALSVGTDTMVYRTGSGSVKFDIDADQSANNKATIYNSDMTAIDIASYTGVGVIRMWLHLPDLVDDSSEYVSSVELRWGSSASAYWSATVTRPVDHFGFVDKWNLLEFRWDEATKTGTPDMTAVDYLLVTVNYGSGQADDTGFRINDIRIFVPYEMELLYFSSSTVKSSASTGVWLARPTSTSDLLLAPDRFKPVYVAAYNYYVATLLYSPDSPQIEMYERKYRGKYINGKWVGGALERIMIEQGERQKHPVRKLVPSVKWSD